MKDFRCYLNGIFSLCFPASFQNTQHQEASGDTTNQMSQKQVRKLLLWIPGRVAESKQGTRTSNSSLTQNSNLSNAPWETHLTWVSPAPSSHIGSILKWSHSAWHPIDLRRTTLQTPTFFFLSCCLTVWNINRTNNHLIIRKNTNSDSSHIDGMCFIS